MSRNNGLSRKPENCKLSRNFPADAPIPLLSGSEIEQWASELGIGHDDMDRLTKLMWRREMEFWFDDPEEYARAFRKQVGFSAFLDIHEAMNAVMDEDDE